MSDMKSSRRRSSAKQTPTPVPGSSLWLLTQQQPTRAVGAGTTTARAASVAKNPTPKKTTASSVAKPTRQTATTAKKKPSDTRNNGAAVPAAPARKRASVTKANGTSLVHDAVRRAFHASVASDIRGGKPPDYAGECERLREELERVMADHQRQADEIVALRALAKSLKEEVEVMQESLVQQHNQDATSDTWRPTGIEMRRAAGHEFFQLDAQIDALKEETAQLRAELQTSQSEKHELQVVIDSEMPRFELLSVHAQAELASTVSQLRDEQAENDRLRSEVVYYKARSRSPVRTERSRSGDVERAVDAHDTRENEKENNGNATVNAASRTRTQGPALDSTLRESLMSSVASLSMSAASVFSSQLENDVETLKSELRRLHRSIDASVDNARRYGSNGNGVSRRPRPVEEHKSSE